MCSRDKQGLVCDGGRRNSCGSRHAPLRGHASPTWFLRYVSLDLDGYDNWYCSGDKSTAAAAAAADDDDDDDDGKPVTPRHNAFTFSGSYYFVYAKLASCPPPTGRSVDVNFSPRSFSATFLPFVRLYNS